MTDIDRRHHQRVPFIAEVCLNYKGKKWACGLQDISLKGLLITVPQTLEVDIDYSYAIELKLSDSAEITMTAKIHHSDQSHWGLAWENIDLDGFTHLRRLLELNMSDPAKLSREIADLTTD